MSSQKRRLTGTPKPEKTTEAAAPSTSMTLVGSKEWLSSLTGSGHFNPTVPVDQPGEEGADALIWVDVPEKLKERLENKPQQITESSSQR